MSVVRALVESGSRHREGRRLVQAEHSYREALALDPTDAGALHGLGVVCFQTGQYARAVELLTQAVARDDAVAAHHSDLGRALYTIGRQDDGVASLWRALDRDPDHLPAHLALTEVLLPGDHYHDLLARLHTALRPPVYLEIGVESGKSLAFARPPTIALGVDPAPAIDRALRPHERIFTMTSDAFFATTELSVVAGKPAIDLAFIDGMHTFDQALRDFINVERRAHARTIVLVHDCLPLSAATATRTQETCFWSGDTWRLIPLLKRHRPDLTIRTVPCRPTGLAIITGLDPASTGLDETFAALAADYIDLPFSYLADDRAAKLDVIPNDWPTIAQHLYQALA
jgi:tetratricopeptide (TPR) repeat protein